MSIDPYAPPQTDLSAPAAELENNPPLWNPNAAAMWSLLFSPVFGALVHMKNWQAMGEPEKAAASKRLTDAGFQVQKNSDEDSYVYVNIITTSPSLGFCVSRYDVFVYTHTTATLSYQTAPVLVQVSLLGDERVHDHVASEGRVAERDAQRFREGLPRRRLGLDRREDRDLQ